MEDEEKLRTLNDDIGKAEDEGDLGAITKIIAPEFAFRRGTGKIDGGIGFLKGIKKSGPRVTEITSIEIYGNRAVVICHVTIAPDTYHNIRLFVRHEDEWKLLGWANEKV